VTEEAINRLCLDSDELEVVRALLDAEFGS
jgi:hypothetical protein